MSIHKNLKRDCAYLERNEIPMEPSGLRIEKLDYEGESSADEKEEPARLNDDDVQKLCEALCKNNTF